MSDFDGFDLSAFQNHVLHTAHELLVRQESNSTTSEPEKATRPPIYKVVGLVLAIASGLFIGVSFVVKKVGLLKANEKYHEEAGEGYGYLKNAWWWLGMGLMIIGEVCNFVAYAFTDAILVTPLGALSVVVTTILSAIFLKERLSLIGKVGCFMCIVGSVVIVLNAPEQSAVADIQQMKHYVIAPGFLSYAGVIIIGCIFIALWAGPRYGKRSMFVYLSICSFIGGLSVVATQGLGAAVIAQISKGNQFNQWFLYFLLVFVITTLLTEIVYLNKALNIFNAALVTPTYYVFFTSTTIITSAILFQGFHGTGVTIATVVMGFLQICAGVVLLQLSKSAKDVPDAAVFKGDLDQVREIAEQENPESEPKADAIRGTASIIRRLSTPRRNLEQMEARRLREEKAADILEPLKEGEVVEWDGLRRRKTIVGAGPTTSPLARRKTIHPPLGMTHFPEEDENAEDIERRGSNPFKLHFRERAQTLFPRAKQHETDHPDMAMQSPAHPVALTEIGSKGANRDSPALPYGAGSFEEAQEHIYGHPVPGVKPAPSPRSKPLPASPIPSEGLKAPSSSKRQFSFSNFMRHSKQSGHGSDHAPIRPSTASSHAERKANKNATEEERLGLVKGDSVRPLMSDTSPEHRRESTLGPARTMSSGEPESPVQSYGSYPYPQMHRSASPDAVAEEGEPSDQRAYLRAFNAASTDPSPLTGTPRNQSVSPMRQRPSPPTVYHPPPSGEQGPRIPSLQPPSEPSLRRVTIGNPQANISADQPHSKSTPSLAPPVQLVPSQRGRSRDTSEVSPGQSLEDVRLSETQQRGRPRIGIQESPERSGESSSGSKERYAEQSARERDERRARAQKRMSTGNNAKQSTDQL